MLSEKEAFHKKAHFKRLKKTLFCERSFQQSVFCAKMWKNWSAFCERIFSKTQIV